MFLYSACWAKFELKGFGSAVMGSDMVKSEDLESEFIPLSGEGEGIPRHKEVDKILRQAEEKAEQLEREAYDKGFAQGEKDGLELGRKKAEKIVDEMERLFKELRGLKSSLAITHEKEILDIVFAVVKKSVHHETLRDESIIQRAVQIALQMATDRSELSLRINPEDVGFVEKVKPGFFTQFRDLKGLTVMPDGSISRGGCVIESHYGDVDGRIETQLDEIYQVLDDAFNRQDA
jgi:flagellar assembly protein FliH